jgi:hypothetical protein
MSSRSAVRAIFAFASRNVASFLAIRQPIWHFAPRKQAETKCVIRGGWARPGARVKGEEIRRTTVIVARPRRFPPLVIAAWGE